MTAQQKQEFTLRITQASRTELTVILYEMLDLYLKDAEDFLEKGSFAEQKDALRKAKGCLTELENSLDFTYEISGNLWSIYHYLKQLLIRAEIGRRADYLQISRRIIRQLCEAFREAAKQDSSGPVMENTQSIYAGLTYGRGELNENLADQGRNRGFCV